MNPKIEYIKNKDAVDLSTFRLYPNIIRHDMVLKTYPALILFIDIRAEATTPRITPM